MSAAVRGPRVLLPVLGDSPSSFLSSRGQCCSGQEVLDLEGGGLCPEKKAPLVQEGTEAPRHGGAVVPEHLRIYLVGR